MKAVRIIIGSISILVFGIGVVIALSHGLATDEVALNAGMMRTSVVPIAFCAAFAGAGFTSIAGRNRPGGNVALAASYWLAAAIGLAAWMAGGDLVIWAVPVVAWALLAAIFGTVFVLPAGSLRAQ
jgi:hypothetical protein